MAQTSNNTSVSDQIRNLTDDDLTTQLASYNQAKPITTNKPISRMTDDEFNNLYTTHVDDPFETLKHAGRSVLGAAAKFGTSALNEMYGIGETTGKVMAGVADQAIGTHMLDTYNKSGAASIRSQTTGAVDKAVDTGYNDVNPMLMKAAGMAGQIAPYMAMPMSGISSLASKGALSGAVERGILGGAQGALSAQASGQDWMQGAGLGSVLGALIPVGNTLVNAGKSDFGKLLGKAQSIGSYAVENELPNFIKGLSKVDSAGLQAYKTAASDLYDKTANILVPSAAVAKVFKNIENSDAINRAIEVLRSGKDPLDLAFQRLDAAVMQGHPATIQYYDLIQRTLNDLGAAADTQHGRAYFLAQKDILKGLDQVSTDFTLARAYHFAAKQGEGDMAFFKINDTAQQMKLKAHLQSAAPDVYPSMYASWMQKSMDKVTPGGGENVFAGLQKGFLGNELQMKKAIRLAPDKNTQDKLLFIGKAYNAIKEDLDSPSYISTLARMIPGGHLLVGEEQKRVNAAIKQKLNKVVSEYIATGKAPASIQDYGKPISKVDATRFFQGMLVQAAKHPSNFTQSPSKSSNKNELDDDLPGENSNSGALD